MRKRSIRRPRTRFAPSPTGWLHLGHALAAREAFGFSARRDAECLLRIEDIDHTRCRPDYTQAIFEDLAWLGFDWPSTPPLGPVRVQSEHMGDYRAVAERLRKMGVLYPCALSRKEVATRSVDGVYRGEARGGKNPAWRLSVPRAQMLTGALSYVDDGVERSVDFDTVNDDILVRRDIGTSYTLAVTHDDALQGITHVVRGEDLRDTTPLQRIVQALVGWAEVEYVHHGLVMADDGMRKLSKRDGATSIRALRERGLGPREVFARAETMMGE